MSPVLTGPMPGSGPAAPQEASLQAKDGLASLEAVGAPVEGSTCCDPEATEPLQAAPKAEPESGRGEEVHCGGQRGKGLA